jgi:hypothetical protein
VHTERRWAAQRHVDGFVDYIPIVIDDTEMPTLEPREFSKIHFERLPNGIVTPAFANKLQKWVEEYRYWGLSSKWTENRGKPGLRQSFFLTIPYLSFFNYLQPILAQRPIWRDVPVERLLGNNSKFAAKIRHLRFLFSHGGHREAPLLPLSS